MDRDAIIRYITDTFVEVTVLRPSDGPGAGDTFFYYDPEHDLDARPRLPFATIVTKDYPGWDETSNLDHPSVFRLNIGVSRDSFRAILGVPPTEVEARFADYDFAALDRLLPHPTYARQAWLCVLNPSPDTFEALKPLLADAYAVDVARHNRRQAVRD